MYKVVDALTHTLQTSAPDLESAIRAAQDLVAAQAPGTSPAIVVIDDTNEVIWPVAPPSEPEKPPIGFKPNR